MTVVYVGAFGVLWIVKFVIYNKLLFGHHHQAAPVEATEVRIWTTW